MGDDSQPRQAKNPMNSMPSSRPSTRYVVVSRAVAAGLQGRSYSLSSAVCSWHICSVGRLEQVNILSCDVCSVLKMKNELQLTHFHGRKRTASHRSAMIAQLVPPFLC